MPRPSCRQGSTSKSRKVVLVACLFTASIKSTWKISIAIPLMDMYSFRWLPFPITLQYTLPAFQERGSLTGSKGVAQGDLCAAVTDAKDPDLPRSRNWRADKQQAQVYPPKKLNGSQALRLHILCLLSLYSWLCRTTLSSEEMAANVRFGRAPLGKKNQFAIVVSYVETGSTAEKVSLHSRFQTDRISLIRPDNCGMDKLTFAWSRRVSEWGKSWWLFQVLCSPGRLAKCGTSMRNPACVLYGMPSTCAGAAPSFLNSPASLCCKISIRSLKIFHSRACWRA